MTETQKKLNDVISNNRLLVEDAVAKGSYPLYKCVAWYKAFYALSKKGGEQPAMERDRVDFPMVAFGSYAVFFLKRASKALYFNN